MQQSYLVVVQAVVFTVFVSSLHAETVCEVLARNLKPDTYLQSNSGQKFSQIQKLISDHTYDSFANAQSASFDGTLLSEYVDIWVKSRSNSNNWQEHREEFLGLNADTAYAASENQVRISRMSDSAMNEIVRCQRAYADTAGFSASLVKVSDNRDSFAVLLTNTTKGGPAWKLTNFSAQPFDGKFHCDNDYQRASIKNPVRLLTNSVLVVCAKSPDANLTLGVQTSVLRGVRMCFSLSVIDSILQSECDRVRWSDPVLVLYDERIRDIARLIWQECHAEGERPQLYGESLTTALLSCLFQSSGFWLTFGAQRRWSSSRVISALADVMAMKGVPEHLRSDNRTLS